MRIEEEEYDEYGIRYVECSVCYGEGAISIGDGKWKTCIACQVLDEGGVMDRWRKSLRFWGGKR